MSEVQTLQDGTSIGTFSQIKLDDGHKILISLTKTEIAIFGVGFLGIPKGTLWKESISKFLDAIYPQGPASQDANKSVLEIAVKLAISCSSVDDVIEKFEGLKKLGEVRDLLGELSEETQALKSWQEMLQKITELSVRFFDIQYKAVRKKLQDTLGNRGGQMNSEQEEELMVLSMMEIVWSVYAVFTEQEAKDIIENIKTAVLDKYLHHPNERKEFEKRFWERWDEYAEVLNPNNENLVIQIGGVFCDHFFGTRVSKVDVMELVGLDFLSSSKEIKKLLEEIRR